MKKAFTPQKLFVFGALFCNATMSGALGQLTEPLQLPDVEPARAMELPNAAPEEVGMSSEKLARVVPVLKQFVDDGKVPGAIVCVARRGCVVLHEAVGWKDIEASRSMEKDSILRFYSMTKAITTVGAMMLVDERKVDLDEPVSKYLGEFEGLKLYSESVQERTAELARAMTVRDLMRHTSGLTYGFFGDTAVDKKYRAAQILSGEDDLAATAEKISKLPLLNAPGTKFVYSVSTDILGHLIERVSGRSLDQFFAERVFEPLDMVDTGFSVPAEKVSRFANNYGPSPNGEGLVVIDQASSSKYLESPRLLSGGGGLVSTARDYMRFCQMLLNGGELGNRRLLKAESVAEMTCNQLPDSAYPIGVGPGDRRSGVGFGLGFSVVVQPTQYTRSSPVGEYGWGGAASTHYWISPTDELAVVVLTQHMPFSFQLENAVKPIVYGALVRE